MLESIKFFIFILLLLLTIMLNQNVTSKKSGELDLNQFWTIENSNRTLKLQNQSIPSGVYTALEQDQIIESILEFKNDITTKWIGLENWTYTTMLECDTRILNYSEVILTFHGVDTFARIYIGNKLLGETNNMFVRYRFDIRHMLQVECRANLQLRVEIRSSVSEAASLAAKYDKLKIVPECPPAVYHGECHVNLIRKMQASYAWDWGLAAPSMGIWKSVKLEFYDSVKIRDLTFALSDEETGWEVVVGVYLETGTKEAQLKGTLTFKFMGIQIETNEEILTVKGTSNSTGEFFINHTLHIPKESVELWWPNGYGAQKLYSLYVRWEDDKINSVHENYHDSRISEKSVRVGFRTVKLCQEPFTDGRMFYFTVNDVPIFMKGSNWIPSSILPEKSADKKYVKYLLTAARDANMNMLRVWGGGVYESNEFYRLADELGILIWQDLMFACSMYPADEDFLETVKLEVQQNVRRIQHHPSIAIWATNNENEVAIRQNWYSTNSLEKDYVAEYKKLYEETIRPTIAEIDSWREILTSSPSNGDQPRDDDYIAKNPQDPRFGDVHYYNYEMDGWNPIIYSGGRFISEYGFQSFPAFTSWPVRDLGLNNLTDLINHRQHSPLGSVPIIRMIDANLPTPSRNSTSYWQNMIYLSQVSQAMIVKTETEVYRSKRVEKGTMGALYWQLNDVWTAPSWSSIEYGGKFKILHHWIKDVFANVHVIAYFNSQNSLDIYAIRDTLGSDEEYTIEVCIHSWKSFLPVDKISFTKIVPQNTVVKFDSYDIYKYLEQKSFSREDHMLFVNLYQNNKKISDNFVFLNKIKKSNLPKPTATVSIAASSCNKSNNAVLYSLEISTTRPALFVYLELAPEVVSLKKCQFSKNGFLQFTPIQMLYLQCIDIDCKSKLQNNDITLQTINSLMN
ncbi:beta-mannosidase [Uranotaenia lowii]|uniref:beta-mannosidase n=1 Tax=Uranotaenia lowii TaxID=190385 RepID=UPI00247AC579|nr:beta-mannosidase [Uranotaenia lowii]XP_055589929.1 beta-mannosidase [Uranotaenia lowii]XP_055589985.1 beta-mannosidase [Uranotaenia lowii]XP_055590050.1 beta-mannosidase [Uranotaenia lowii]